MCVCVCIYIILYYLTIWISFGTHTYISTNTLLLIRYYFIMMSQVNGESLLGFSQEHTVQALKVASTEAKTHAIPLRLTISPASPGLVLVSMEEIFSKEIAASTILIDPIITCLNCRTTLPPRAKFCRSCGHKCQTYTTSSNTTNDTPTVIPTVGDSGKKPSFGSMKSFMAKPAPTENTITPITMVPTVIPKEVLASVEREDTCLEVLPFVTDPIENLSLPGYEGTVSVAPPTDTFTFSGVTEQVEATNTLHTHSDHHIPDTQDDLQIKLAMLAEIEAEQQREQVFFLNYPSVCFLF